MRVFMVISVLLGLALFAALAYGVISHRPSVSSDSSTLGARVAALEAERDVLTVIDQLDLSVDQKDWLTVRALFHDTIDVDLTSLGGEPQPMQSDDLVTAWRNNLFEGKPTYHMRGGALVDIEGDTARAIATNYVLNTLPKRAEASIWEVWGRYEFTLRRDEKGWRISGLRYEAFDTRGDEAIRSEFGPVEAQR